PSVTLTVKSTMWPEFTPEPLILAVWVVSLTTIEVIRNEWKLTAGTAPPSLYSTLPLILFSHFVWSEKWASSTPCPWTCPSPLPPRHETGGGGGAPVSV